MLSQTRSFSQLADFNLETEFLQKFRSCFCEKQKCDSLAFGKCFTLLSSLPANTSVGNTVLYEILFFFLFFPFLLRGIKD